MKRALPALAAFALLPAAVADGIPADAAPGNLFNEPFLALGQGMEKCPVPRGPWMTREQALRDSHWRAQSGVSCYVAGKCRLMNSYMYDAEIATRVKETFSRDYRFEGSSVWAHVQRRIVTLMGCVRDAEQAALITVSIQAVDDVIAVVPQFTVGPSESPPYEVAPTQAVQGDSK